MDAEFLADLMRGTAIRLERSDGSVERIDPRDCTYSPVPVTTLDNPALRWDSGGAAAALKEALSDGLVSQQ